MKASIREFQQAEDPFNRINTARVRKGKIVKSSVEEIPWHAFSKEPFEKKKAKDREKKRPPEKIHPLLKRWLAERSGNAREPILISFHDNLKIPRFPEPVTDKPRDSATNKKAIRRAEGLIQE